MIGAPAKTISAHDMLPDVLRCFPHLRRLFDSYGLRGCGGAHGPAETIGYFARAHGVDETILLEQLNAATINPSTVPHKSPDTSSDLLNQLADNIYRRFFKAGIVVILTAGAAWGALLLLRIAWNKAFTAISIHDINAHGHAQIFGWAGMFIMGFAYQAFPRMKHTSLWRPDLANMSFYLMVFGVFARAIGEPLFQKPLFRELAVAASFAEIAAIAIFIGVLLKTIQKSGKAMERNDFYILASLGFFFIQAIYDLLLLYATTAAVGREDLLRIISTYQAPLRDLQIHGFAMLMILGVGIRMFPALFGMATPGRKLVRNSLIVLISAVFGEAGFLIVMRRSGDHLWGIPLYASMLALAGASVSLTFRWGLFGKTTERDRSTKFVRFAMAWLHTSMLMLVLAPIYMRLILPTVGNLSAAGHDAATIGFSHAYYGAVRHAITVGFISLMILGMAGKVVPTLNGVDIRKLHALWVPFVLVNVGCMMRVGFQIATDFGEWAFPFAGASGLLEVSGIGIWGIHLWRIMNGWRPTEDALQKPQHITAEDKIGQVVEWFPETLPLLISKGFTPLANPLMRKTMARAVSIRMAAAHHNLNVDELVTELNTVALGNRAPESRTNENKFSLRVLSHA